MFFATNVVECKFRDFVVYQPFCFVVLNRFGCRDLASTASYPPSRWVGEMGSNNWTTFQYENTATICCAHAAVLLISGDINMITSPNNLTVAVECKATRTVSFCHFEFMKLTFLIPVTLNSFFKSNHVYGSGRVAQLPHGLPLQTFLLSEHDGLLQLLASTREDPNRPVRQNLVDLREPTEEPGNVSRVLSERMVNNVLNRDLSARFHSFVVDAEYPRIDIFKVTI